MSLNSLLTSSKKSNNFSLFQIFEKNKNSSYKDIFRKLLFAIKVIIYLFSFIMISWSFFQTMFYSYAKGSNNPGEGLEAAFFRENGKAIKEKIFDDRYYSEAEMKKKNYYPLTEKSNSFGPFIDWFVYPLSRGFLNIIWFFRDGEPKNHGEPTSFLDKNGLNVIFAIIVVLLIMKLIVFLTIFRAQYYSDLQQRHKKNLDRIKNKYSSNNFDKKEWKNASMLRQKEMGEYCKKHRLKPYAALENFFINTPIFLVVYKLMTITRPIKYAKLFSIMELSKTPVSVIFSSDFFPKGLICILFFVIAIPVNLYSQRIPSNLMKRRFPSLQSDNPLKFKNVNLVSSRKLQNIISISLIIFSLFWSTSLAIYYFFNSLFNIVFSHIIHYILMKRKVNDSSLSKKLKNLGI